MLGLTTAGIESTLGFVTADSIFEKKVVTAFGKMDVSLFESALEELVNNWEFWVFVSKVELICKLIFSALFESPSDDAILAFEEFWGAAVIEKLDFTVSVLSISLVLLESKEELPRMLGSLIPASVPFKFEEFFSAENGKLERLMVWLVSAGIDSTVGFVTAGSIFEKKVVTAFGKMDVSLFESALEELVNNWEFWVFVSKVELICKLIFSALFESPSDDAILAFEKFWGAAVIETLVFAVSVLSISLVLLESNEELPRMLGSVIPASVPFKFEEFFSAENGKLERLKVWLASAGIDSTVGFVTADRMFEKKVETAFGKIDVSLFESVLEELPKILVFAEVELLWKSVVFVDEFCVEVRLVSAVSVFSIIDFEFIEELFRTNVFGATDCEKVDVVFEDASFFVLTTIAEELFADELFETTLKTSNCCGWLLKIEEFFGCPLFLAFVSVLFSVVRIEELPLWDWMDPCVAGKASPGLPVALLYGLDVNVSVAVWLTYLFFVVESIGCLEPAALFLVLEIDVVFFWILVLSNPLALANASARK
jgi:hypothetical protein